MSSTVLREEGYEVIAARSGERAEWLETAGRLHPARLAMPA
jgi:hypothetical protein